jgi:hypothetical protein
LSAGSTLEALAGWSVDARSAALACGPRAAGAVPEGETVDEADVADETALLSAPAEDAASPEED